MVNIVKKIEDKLVIKNSNGKVLHQFDSIDKISNTEFYIARSFGYIFILNSNYERQDNNTYKEIFENCIPMYNRHTDYVDCNIKQPDLNRIVAALRIVSDSNLVNYALINRKGIIKNICDDFLFSIDYDATYIKSQGKWGMVDEYGEIYHECIYDTIKPMEPPFALSRECSHAVQIYYEIYRLSGKVEYKAIAYYNAFYKYLKSNEIIYSMYLKQVNEVSEYLNKDGKNTFEKLHAIFGEIPNDPFLCDTFIEFYRKYLHNK